MFMLEFGEECKRYTDKGVMFKRGFSGGVESLDMYNNANDNNVILSMSCNVWCVSCKEGI